MVRRVKLSISMMIFVALLLVTVSMALAAEPPLQQAGQVVVEVIRADGQLTTLVSALEAANLIDALNGQGPFTVFAPADDAFAALPAGVLDELLADPNALREVMLYHVVPERLPAGEVTRRASLTTIQGQPLRISPAGNTTRVNNAQIVISDVQAANGVIHVIDAVLLPPAYGDWLNPSPPVNQPNRPDYEGYPPNYDNRMPGNYGPNRPYPNYDYGRGYRHQPRYCGPCYGGGYHPPYSRYNYSYYSYYPYRPQRWW